MCVSGAGMTRAVLLRRLAIPLACALFALVVDAVVYVVVLGPSHAVMEQTDTAWRSERARIARFKTYQQAHAEVTNLIKQATAREDLPNVVTTLASLAKRRGLSIPEVNYQPERVDLKDFQKVSLTFALSGPYAKVRRFLDDLERLGAVGNEILKPRIERLLGGHARAALLAHVQEAALLPSR